MSLPTKLDEKKLLDFYRRILQYVRDKRNHVWHWYITNLVEPLRLSSNPAQRLVGNPPWVVYNTMAKDRQDEFRQHAQARKLWATAKLATQNDIAATFVATCVDFYLQAGGKFGFVLPYAALRARQWAPFRSGKWGLPESEGREPSFADLSQKAWNLAAVNAPPFRGQASSCVVFGTKKRRSGKGKPTQAVPLSGILAASNAEPVNTRMSWDVVRKRLVFTQEKSKITAPSEAYAKAFRNGATLFPQPLVVFESPRSQALGKVWFTTNKGKETWRGLERDGQVESRFVKPALFSRQLIPFGTTGQSHVIAPFAQDGRSLGRTLPPGDAAALFRLYWDKANYDWRTKSGPRPPLTLLDQVDYQGKLASQLKDRHSHKVVFSKSGTWLTASVVTRSILADGTLYWYASSSRDELHYLAALFNAKSLAEFFKVHGRASDRDFHTGPVRNLPIPKFDASNEHHANLAAQSDAAHRRVAKLVKEQAAKSSTTTRKTVMEDKAMERILKSIDQSVRAILPDYCSSA